MREPWEIQLDSDMASMRKSTESIQKSFRIIIGIITLVLLYEIGTTFYMNFGGL